MDETIEREILSYLLDHPDAEDSVEGIAEWWVLERCVERGVAEVGSALEALVRRGFVSAGSPSPDSPRYRLNRDRLDDVQGFLGAAAPDGAA